MIEFKKEGIPSISQSGIRIFYKGEIIDEHYADMLVDNKVIVKIKATKDVVEDNEEQLMHCLKAANMGAGVLLNFGTKPEVKLMYL
jgi:GxxExxY protein